MNCKAKKERRLLDAQPRRESLHREKYSVGHNACLEGLATRPIEYELDYACQK